MFLFIYKYISWKLFSYNLINLNKLKYNKSISQKNFKYKYLQDDELVKTEQKRINLIQNNKSSERTNIYYALFLKDQSTI